MQSSLETAGLELVHGHAVDMSQFEDHQQLNEFFDGLVSALPSGRSDGSTLVRLCGPELLLYCKWLLISHLPG
jgi:hypothetical protein